jgi:antitoxin VapB
MITLPPETEQLARLVAARSGKTPEDVLKQGVEMEARIAGVAIAESAKPRKEIDVERVREIARDVSSAPLRDTRTPNEILDEAWGQPG